MNKSDICYQREAFKLTGSGTRQQLEAALETAQRDVLRGGHGNWIVHTIDLVLDGNSPRLELAVLVPSGNDQREELFAAVTFFEIAMARELGAPVDKTFRTIEDGGPKCEVCGSNKIDWVRTTPYIGNERYFCDGDARWESDFGGNAATSPNAFLYVRQRPYNA